MAPRANWGIMRKTSLPLRARGLPQSGSDGPDGAHVTTPGKTREGPPGLETPLDPSPHYAPAAGYARDELAVPALRAPSALLTGVRSRAWPLLILVAGFVAYARVLGDYFVM